MTPDERDPVVKGLFEGLEAPAPPPQLRSLVLAAAGEMKMEAPDLWTRLWNQPWLRLAWAAAVVLLLAGHVLLVPGNGAGIPGVDSNLMAENRVDEHLVEFLRPMRISDDVRPIIGLFSDSGDPYELDMKGNPS